MAEKGTVSQEDYDRLLKRIQALEEQLAASDDKNGSDSMSDMGNRFMKESNKMVRGMMDATIEALSETANAMSSGGGDAGEKLRDGEVGEGLISAYDRFIDIQKKALDKFRERYQKEDDD